MIDENKKPVQWLKGMPICPACGYYSGIYYNQEVRDTCSRCGQAVDWQGIDPRKGGATWQHTTWNY